MMDGIIIDEIAALGPVRVQNAFMAAKTMLVLELYSPQYKKNFLVCDTWPETQTLHIQPEKPAGKKSLHPFLLLLKKICLKKTVQFRKADNHHQALKISLDHENKTYHIVFDSFPHMSAGIFCNHELLALLGSNKKLELKPGFTADKPHLVGLLHNFIRGKAHQEMRRQLTLKTSFDDHLARLRHTIKKQEKLKLNVEKDLVRCQLNLTIQHEAELLRANLHLVKRGMKELDVLDYTKNPPLTTKLLLDPKLSGREMLDQWFTRVKKAKRGIALIEPRLNLIKQDLETSKIALCRLMETGIGEEAFEAVNAPIQPSVTKKTTRKPYKTYLSSDNIKILVGRSAKDSDDLTSHIAHGNDWWFHVQDYAGAHVVVKYGQDNLPQKTFKEACMLAQHFSKSKAHDTALVHYTRAKYVKKPKGFVKGRVLISKDKVTETIKDETALKTLLSREQKTS